MIVWELNSLNIKKDVESGEIRELNVAGELNFVGHNVTIVSLKDKNGELICDVNEVWAGISKFEDAHFS